MLISIFHLNDFHCQTRSSRSSQAIKNQIYKLHVNKQFFFSVTQHLLIKSSNELFIDWWKTKSLQRKLSSEKSKHKTFFFLQQPNKNYFPIHDRRKRENRMTKRKSINFIPSFEAQKGEKFPSTPPIIFFLHPSSYERCCFCCHSRATEVKQRVLSRARHEASCNI